MFEKRKVRRAAKAAELAAAEAARTITIYLVHAADDKAALFLSPMPDKSALGRVLELITQDGGKPQKVYYEDAPWLINPKYGSAARHLGKAYNLPATGLEVEGELVDRPRWIARLVDEKVTAVVFVVLRPTIESVCREYGPPDKKVQLPGGGYTVKFAPIITNGGVRPVVVRPLGEYPPYQLEIELRNELGVPQTAV